MYDTCIYRDRKSRWNRVQNDPGRNDSHGNLHSWVDYFVTNGNCSNPRTSSALDEKDWSIESTAGQVMPFKVSPPRPATHFFSNGCLGHVVIDFDAVRIYLMSYLSVGMISISSWMISPSVLSVWKISPLETYSSLCLEDRSASTLDDEGSDHRWSTAEEWPVRVRVCPNTVQSDACSQRTVRSLVVNHLSCELSHSISSAYRWADRDIYPS